MKLIKSNTKQRVITTKTYVVELTEDEYNWLMSHPNFESYNYGSIWFNENHHVNAPYNGVIVKDCDNMLHDNSIRFSSDGNAYSLVGTTFSTATKNLNCAVDNNNFSYIVKSA